MSIIFWNIKSIYPKMDAIRMIANELKPDIMCFSETWLNQYIDNSDVHINGYILVRNDRKSINARGNPSRGGGVCIYVLAKYKFDVIYDQLNLSSNDVESITIKVNLKDTRPIYITNVYRPPSGDLKKCLQHLGDLLEFMDQSNNYERFLGGDFNPLDPTDLPFNMRYFPRISRNSLEISPKLRSNIAIQSPSHP